MTFHSPTVNANKEDCLLWSARTLAIQFKSLATRLAPERLSSELKSLPRLHHLRKSPTCETAQILSCLTNSWSTEKLLKDNRTTFTGDALRNSLVWAFAQAYYSCFMCAFAFFKTVGFTEGATHASLIRKFGQEVESRHYPTAISFYCHGGLNNNIKWFNLNYNDLQSQFHFIANDPTTTDTHIKRFLGTTRHNDLNSRLSEKKLRTKQGKLKERFSAEDYSNASPGLGPTSLFSLLYRKRIKSNYQDIDTYLNEGIDAEGLFKDLCQVVSALNMVHEAFLAKMLSKSLYESEILGKAKCELKLAKQRYDLFCEII